MQSLDEQSKQLIWWLRYVISDKVDEYPHGLLFLLYSVNWDNHIEVSKVNIIL